MLTAIFIDGGYLDKCSQKGIDYSKLSATLADGERLLQTYYYNGYPYDASKDSNPDPNHLVTYEKRAKFFRGLEGLPKFTCRYGHTVFRNGTFMQKGVDSLISVDMLTLAARQTIDSIKLLSGDKDLIHAVRAVREFGIIVDLFTFSKGTFANDLKGECDNCRQLDANCNLIQS
jgi:uncharacterized LabA/DUF88 family protein